MPVTMQVVVDAHVVKLTVPCPCIMTPKNC